MAAPPLFLNELLLQHGIDVGLTRLLRHLDTRSDPDRTPFHLWRDKRNLFEQYQATQSISAQTRLKPASYWISFVVDPDDDRTVLAGAYEARFAGPLAEDTPTVDRDGIDLAIDHHFYLLTRLAEFEDLEGQLVIDWGASRRAWIQRADRQNKRIISFPSRSQLRSQDAADSDGHGEQPSAVVRSIPIESQKTESYIVESIDSSSEARRAEASLVKAFAE